MFYFEEYVTRRELVDASSLEIFRGRQDRTLSNLLYLKMSLLILRGLDERAFKAPLQPKLFCVSVKHIE